MGLSKLKAIWNGIRDSLWFLPGVLTVGISLLALLTIQLDVIGVLPETPGGLWLFSGSASGARGVLTAIASGFITVTGVVFSITIVALQLASTQFTPRILRNFTADRANQVVLGVFIATFTYSLLVLRVVRGEDGGVTPEDLERGGQVSASMTDAFVPHLSVTVAVVLALVGIAFLIFFIHHAAQSVQASVILHRVTQDALETVDRLLPDRVGLPADDPAPAVMPRAAPGTLIGSDRSGYVQGMDEEKLLDLLRDGSLVVEMEVHVGSFIMPGTTVATVWPAGLEARTDLVALVLDALVVGHARTPHMDIELGLIELSDIAVKALSPGVNDPTTAILCVDRLCEILLAFGRREEPRRVRRPPEGDGVLLLPPLDFDRLVQTACDEIRHYGVQNPRFAITLLEKLGDLGVLLPARRRTAIARQVAALLRTGRKITRDGSDLRRLEAAGRRAIHRLRVVGAP